MQGHVLFLPCLKQVSACMHIKYEEVKACGYIHCHLHNCTCTRIGVDAEACSALVDRPAKRQRTSRQSDEEEIVDCNACIGAHLSGGVHPSGAASSSSILKMPQPIIKRGDQMFFRLVYVIITLPVVYIYSSTCTASFILREGL